MQLKRTLFILISISLGITSCKKDEVQSCLEQSTTASFNVNGEEFNSLQENAWLNTGIQHSLLFMQQQPNGDQHVVNVIFEGDTTGTYPLLGINATNRASYFAPNVNGTTFPDTILPGTLVVTELDNEMSCLSGYYLFTADTLEVSGEFQSLGPN